MSCMVRKSKPYDTSHCVEDGPGYNEENDVICSENGLLFIHFGTVRPRLHIRP